jgi:hypothetical protein
VSSYAPPRPPEEFRYHARSAGNAMYGPRFAADLGGTGANPNNVGQAFRMPVSRQILTIADIRCYVVTAGHADSVVRLGIWEDSRDDYPGDLLFETAEISTATAGLKTATAALDIPAGSWLGSGIRGTTRPAMRTFSMDGKFIDGRITTSWDRYFSEDTFAAGYVFIYGASMPDPFTPDCQGENVMCLVAVSVTGVRG